MYIHLHKLRNSICTDVNLRQLQFSLVISIYIKVQMYSVHRLEECPIVECHQKWSQLERVLSQITTPVC